MSVDYHPWVTILSKVTIKEILSLTLSRSTSVINIPNSEHIHASDKYILSFISVRSFAEQERVNTLFIQLNAALK